MDKARLLAWGVDDGYFNAMGGWMTPPDETLQQLVSALGADAATEPPAGSMTFARHGSPPELGAAARVITEDGREFAGNALPADLPVGYHSLSEGETTSVLAVTPTACQLRPGMHDWGWAAQIHSMHTAKSWGFGDLGDLGDFGDWARSTGASVVIGNPLHGQSPCIPQQSSPYFPSSRQFRNPLYLRIEDVPGAAAAAPALEACATAGRALNTGKLINHDAVFRVKMDALDIIWRTFPRDEAGFAAYRSEIGQNLTNWAAYCVLAEHHGPNWYEWPEEFRNPSAPAVAAVCASKHDRLEFHMWLQWLVDEQLRSANTHIGLVNDLAIGADPAGADGWMHQDVFVPGFSVGAPPDIFNTQGQNWGLRALDPWRLRAANYQTFIQLVRANLRHSAGVRVDHVMGLFRLYCVPHHAPNTAGTYLRYPHADLLDIVAIESYKAGAFVVGEDLGTVEPAVRTELSARNLLSYRLVIFEDDPPSSFPEKAMSTVSTHDLPTIAGLWSGTDLAAQHRIGLQPNEEATAESLARIERAGNKPGDAIDEVIVRTYAELSEAPSVLVCATLEDACASEDRPNMPGTMGDRWPNWSQRLPLSVEELAEAALPRAIVDTMKSRHRVAEAAPKT